MVGLVQRWALSRVERYSLQASLTRVISSLVRPKVIIVELAPTFSDILIVEFTYFSWETPCSKSVLASCLYSRGLEGRLFDHVSGLCWSGMGQLGSASGGVCTCCDSLWFFFVCSEMLWWRGRAQHITILHWYRLLALKLPVDSFKCMRLRLWFEKRHRVNVGRITEVHFLTQIRFGVWSFWAKQGLGEKVDRATCLSYFRRG